jgi:triacylglycerol lipase
MTTDDLLKLLPPDLEYDYFKNAKAFPFQAAADRFELANAAWLLDLSFLAYVQDMVFITDQLRKIGFHERVEFVGFDDLTRSTQCFVIHNDEIIIVVFRGTELRGEGRIKNIILDILTDTRIVLIQTEDGGAVHAGFKDVTDQIWERLEPVLKTVKQRQEVWFTGHSLGAAIATTAADKYSKTIGDVRGLYTFGSPRVGDEEFVNRFRPPAYRIVNGRDIVTTVPFLGPAGFLRLPLFYKHVGELTYIDSEGHIGNEDPRTMVEIQSILRAITSGTLTQSIMQPFIDHAPILYAQRLWGNLTGER